MARLPAAQENAALDAMFVTSTTYYLALNSTDPGTTGAGEITGGSYARQAITFAAASGGSKASSNSQTFTGLPAEAGGIPYASIWTAATAGTFLGGLTTTGMSGAVSAGSTVTVATGATTWAQS